MASQNKNVRYVTEVKKILKYEKEYMKVLNDIIISDEFQDGLKEMFACMDMSKDLIESKYEGANFINTPAERLVAYHLYRYLHNKSLFDDSTCFPSPVCSDIAIELEDVILNVEVKTLGIIQNKTDLNYLPFETNQITFDNAPIFKSGLFDGYEVVANMEPYAGGKTVVTYVIEIVYDYDPKDKKPCFQLYSGNLPNGISTINLFCIPNGKISFLFDKNIVINFKDYRYYEKEAKDNQYFAPKKINSKKYKKISDINSKKKEFQKYLRNRFKLDDNWKDISNEMIGFIDTNNVGNEFHEKKGFVWIVVAKGKGAGAYLQLEPVKGGGTGRIGFEQLKERYDENIKEWDGVTHYTIK